MKSSTKDALCEFSTATTEGFLLLTDAVRTSGAPTTALLQLLQASRNRITVANKALKHVIASDETITESQ